MGAVVGSGPGKIAASTESDVYLSPSSSHTGVNGLYLHILEYFLWLLKMTYFPLGFNFSYLLYTFVSCALVSLLKYTLWNKDGEKRKRKRG